MIIYKGFVLQEIEGKVQDIKTKSYGRLIEALQHNWRSITTKTHRLMPVLLCKDPSISYHMKRRQIDKIDVQIPESVKPLFPSELWSKTMLFLHGHPFHRGVHHD